MDITATSLGSTHRPRTPARSSSSRRRGGRIYAAEPSRPGRRLGLTGVEILVVIVLVAAVIAAALLSGSSVRPPSTTVPVTVGAGESLWSIAEAHAVRGMNVQQTVDLIKRYNHLSEDTIAAGSVLQVPSQAPHAPAVALAR